MRTTYGILAVIATVAAACMMVIPAEAADACITTDSTLLSTVEAKIVRHGTETGRTDLHEMFTQSYNTMKGNDTYTTSDIKARPDKQGSNWQGAGPNELWQKVYSELDRLEACRDAAATPADTTPPVLTLTGDATVIISAGTAYTDAGATCTDDTDGAISPISSGTVDISTPGNYAISYSCTDTAGNAAAPVARTVLVADTTPPVLTLTGGTTSTIDLGTTYTAPVATCTDNVDGAISPVSSGTVDASTAGTYSISYSCTDTAGNKATQLLLVTVEPPKELQVVRSIVVSAPANVTQGDSFTVSTAFNNFGGQSISTFGVTYSNATDGSFVTFPSFTATDDDSFVGGVHNGTVFTTLPTGVVIDSSGLSGVWYFKVSALLAGSFELLTSNPVAVNVVPPPPPSIVLSAPSSVIQGEDFTISTAFNNFAGQNVTALTLAYSDSPGGTFAAVASQSLSGHVYNGAVYTTLPTGVTVGSTGLSGHVYFRLQADLQGGGSVVSDTVPVDVRSMLRDTPPSDSIVYILKTSTQSDRACFNVHWVPVSDTVTGHRLYIFMSTSGSTDLPDPYTISVGGHDAEPVSGSSYLVSLSPSARPTVVCVPGNSGDWITLRVDDALMGKHFSDTHVSGVLSRTMYVD